MNAYRFFAYLKVTLLLLLFSLMVWSCGEGPTQVDVQGKNDPPDTIISQKSLKKVPLDTDSTGAVINLDLFIFTISYSGTDLDGKVDSFQVRVNDGPWSPFTVKTTASDTVSFDSQTATNTVFVRAKDEQGDVDPTPASAEFSLSEIEANAQPTTAFESGPANGATTSAGVQFVVAGTDADGQVVEFSFSIDGGAASSIAADSDGKAVIAFSQAKDNLLSLGNHIVSVQAIDNLGGMDETPETRSFFVSSGFKPVLTQTSGPPPGGGWFTGANIPFAWTATTSHYAGVIERFEFSIDDPEIFTETSASSVSLDPQPAGPHIFRLRAVDIAGNVSDLLEVNFEVALFAPTEGILFMDNVSFVPSGSPYADEPDTDQRILDGFFKNFTKVSVWDLDRLSGSRRFPGAINATSLPGPSDLARFSSVVIMTDFGAPASSDVRSISALLAAYFQAGGNLLVTGYNTTTFGQVLKDALGARVFNGFGSDNFQSLEGFQAASSRNSDAYAFLTGPDIVPVIPKNSPRSWEIIFHNSPALRIMFANVGADDSRQGFSIATELQGAKGNWGIWIGISLFYLDQSSTGIVKLGDFILGNRFGEM